MTAHNPTPSLAGLAIPVALRDQLISLSTEIHVRVAPRRALAQLRFAFEAAFRDAAALEAARPEDGHAARVQLADAAVLGLLHMARVTIDSTAMSILAPLACIAIGTYPVPLAAAPSRGGLLLLLPDRPQQQSRGRTIADFVTDGLDSLGVPLVTTVSTLADIQSDEPRFAPLLARRRFIHGRYDLFVELSTLWRP